MVKTTEVVYKYVEGEFAVKHKKDGFKANSTRVLIGYLFDPRDYLVGFVGTKKQGLKKPLLLCFYNVARPQAGILP